MTKHNVNIFFQERTYNKIKDLVERRQISRFINELVEEKLQKEEQQNKEQIRQQLIKGYQAVANSQKRYTEDEIWDETSGDGLE